jgi:hypothetical protein
MRHIKLLNCSFKLSFFNEPISHDLLVVVDTGVKFKGVLYSAQIVKHILFNVTFVASQTSGSDFTELQQ